MSALLSVVPVSSPAVEDSNKQTSYEGFESFVDEFVVASFLKITPRRVVEMARNGELPAHPIGHERKTWRFRLREIDAHFRSPKKSVSVAMPAAVYRSQKEELIGIGDGNIDGNIKEGTARFRRRLGLSLSDQ
jgi:hypothetical protein